MTDPLPDEVPMRALLVHNRQAGDSVATTRELRTMLERAGYQVRVRSSDGAWTRGLQDGVDLVIAAGGDGTAAKVAKGVAGTGIPFAILPFGTANNLAKSLGVTGDTAELVAGWRGSRAQPFDVGIVTTPGGRRRRFVEGAGSGLFARLIREGERHVPSPRIVGRETDRALHLLLRLAEEAEPGEWRVTVDGADHSGRYVGVEVMNIRFAGPNVPIALDAMSGDGRLDVVCIDAQMRDRIAGYADRRLTTASGDLDGLPAVRGGSVVIEPPREAIGHLDDRVVAAGTRLMIEVAPEGALVLA